MMAWWTDVFQAAMDPEVEDISLAIGRPPLMRCGEHLAFLGDRPLTAEQTLGLFEAIAPPHAVRQLHALGETEFIYRLDPAVRFAVRSCKFRGRVALVLHRTARPLSPTRNPEED
jgi:Tfp pilus assembly ATPase PilU